MPLSFNQLKSEFQTVFDRITAQTTWKEDLGRGVKTLLSGGTFFVDQSLSEIETLRLRRQLEEVEKRLFLAYQSLGKRCMDHWVRQQTLDEKERVKACEQITAILAEKEKLLDQITAAKNPVTPEAASPSESVPE
ncbi:MAG: hypothetical protein ACE5F7_05710 [Nitrospiria bacterium]